MSVVVKVLEKPSAKSDPASWAQVLEDNIDATNDTFAEVAETLENILDDVPVREVKIGDTSYLPNALGVVGLPSNAPRATPMTTAQRDALSGAELFLGRLIYNTTVGQFQVYGNNGWGTTASTAANTSLQYTGGILTTITERDANGVEVGVTTLVYSGGNLTQVIEKRGNVTTTTTLTYVGGILTAVSVA